MQKMRDRSNLKKGVISEDVAKAISGFLIILVFIAAIALIGNSGGGSSSSSSGSTKVEKISFVVNDYVFEVPKDTTWESFVNNSSYNTVGFTIKDACVYLGENKIISSKTYLPVSPSMLVNSYIDYIDESLANLITFSIEGVKYFATPGMTWGEWVESEYNTGDYTHVNSTIRPPSHHCVYLNGDLVSYSREIYANAEYKHGEWNSGSGGSV